MNKALVGLLISLGFLVPVLASASSAPKPPKDTTPPAVTAVRIASSNADHSRAKAGDTVTITFTTSEKVQTPIVLVNAKPLILRATGTSGTAWSASYTVVAKDPLGKAQYAIAMADTADNAYACTSTKTILQILGVKYCPTTDGSSVTIYKDMVTPPPADTQAPVIAAHANVYATTLGTSAAVSYTAPTATDNVDTSVAVSCAPVSGSAFSLGTTTVMCSAHDAAGNSATSAFAVVVTQQVVVPPADTQAPAIAAHEDVHATTSETTAAVEYALPTATDNVDSSVVVSCTPASGSAFAVGTNTVTCSAHDAAGNNASPTTFLVVVEQEVVVPPTGPYTMNSQLDEHFLCGEEYRDWHFCNHDANFSFTDNFDSSKATIELGQGSVMGTGILQTVTIAKDAQGSVEAENNQFHPWLITISCFTDSSHGTACSDWAAISDRANETDDGKHWSADFSSLNRTFNPSEDYVMTIDEADEFGVWPAAVFGSETLQEPYWVITGLH
jgi:hypothetical protein